MLQKHKYEIILLIAALAWLAVFSWLTQTELQDFIYPDAESYQESAINLYSTFSPHVYRPILMAAISGIPLIFGFDANAILNFSFYINLLCWLGSVLLIYRIIAAFSNRTVAFWSATAFIFLIGSNALVFHLLSESVFIFMMLLAFYLLMRYFESYRFSFLAFSISLFLLAMLVRPGAMFFGLFMLIWFIRPVIRHFRNIYSISILASVALIFLQLGLMKKHHGNFTISYIDAVTYYNYLGTKAENIRDGEIFVQMRDKRSQRMLSLAGSQQKKLAAADISHQLQSNKINLVKAYVSNLAENTKTGSTAVADCKNVKNRAGFEVIKNVLYAVSKWQNRILTFVGFFLALYFIAYFRRSLFFALISAFVVNVLVLSGISSSQGDRFHMVTFGFVIILAAQYVAGFNFKRYAAQPRKR